MKLNRLFIAVTFALTPAIIEAQEISIGNEERRPIEERIIYNRETTLHLTANTQGLGGGFKLGKIRSIYKTTYWDFEVMYLKSLKQIKQINLYGYNTSSFVYGKLNDVLALRGGYAEERRIYGKPYWGGVELRWLYELGASIALLKPYYYAVIVAETTTTGEYQQVLKYQTFDDRAQWIDIIGKAPFKQGLNETKPYPGIYAKGGMSFEIGTSRTRAQSIEAGAMIEYFPQGINLMAENPTEYVFTTLYLSYSWGSRYNKY